MIAIEKFLTGLTRHPPASDAAIRACERAMGAEFPEEFVQFLKVTNGCDGTPGGLFYVRFWTVEELPACNQASLWLRDNPGVIAFGEHEGSDMLAFDTRSIPWPIVEIPYISIGWEDVYPMATSFNQFLERLYEFGCGSGDLMSLTDITRTLHLVDGGFTIYAVKPWTPDSMAAQMYRDTRETVSFPDVGELALFMTSENAQKFLAGLPGVGTLSPRERCERLIEHARNSKPRAGPEES